MKKNKKTLLWLDDYRDPKEKEWKKLIESYSVEEPNVVWVKNDKEFIKYITENTLPDIISFDHDLHESHYVPQYMWSDYYQSSLWQDFKKRSSIGATGYNCAGFLVMHCKKNNLQLPEYYCHSLNPVGRDRILGLLNWEKENNFKE